ncbi:hypothetical protein QVD17_25983 [Tagetes erecta]|uniref:Uncharacterized protein n=1 Tax=Tagetes erecta TaxID=13708 RepID=A0AAD8NQD9_TARER|nr:hypothetical protein QVD17_25983 [Tagetes erecta]
MMETMNKHNKQIFQDHHHNSWGLIANFDQETIEETSTISNESSSSFSSLVSSCSSLDTLDDASSLTSSSSSSSLHDLSNLMIQLPIKRGLSKFYHGKSESFTSLARVMSIEDLPKKMKINPYNKMKKKKKKMKANTQPKPIISKKHSSCLRQRSFARSTLVNKTTNIGI